MKTLCASGHRPDGLLWFKGGYNKILHERFLEIIKENVEFAIKSGFSRFIAGGALGIDTDFALLILALKEQYGDITLEIAVPCKGQENSWSSKDKDVYRYILEHADKVTYLSEKYYPFCMQRRNEYMVNNSDAVLVCWNGIKKGGTYHTAKLAMKQNKSLLYIDVSENALNGSDHMIYFKNKLF